MEKLILVKEGQFDKWEVIFTGTLEELRRDNEEAFEELEIEDWTDVEINLTEIMGPGSGFDYKLVD